MRTEQLLTAVDSRTTSCVVTSAIYMRFAGRLLIIIEAGNVQLRASNEQLSPVKSRRQTTRHLNKCSTLGAAAAGYKREHTHSCSRMHNLTRLKSI